MPISTPPTLTTPALPFFGRLKSRRGERFTFTVIRNPLPLPEPRSCAYEAAIDDELQYQFVTVSSALRRLGVRHRKLVATLRFDDLEGDSPAASFVARCHDVDDAAHFAELLKQEIPNTKLVTVMGADK